MKYDELEKLNALREKGILSEEEYQKEKEKILSGQQSFSSANGDLMGMQENTYCMVLHLSQFLGFIIPLLGLIAPIVLWLINKEKNRNIDRHGRVVLNWMLSCLIYAIICYILVFVWIGMLLLPALMIVSIVFIILGAIRANEGILWRYPLSIEFLKIPETV